MSNLIFFSLSFRTRQSIQKELERKRPTISSMRTPTPPVEKTLNVSYRSQEVRSPSDTSRSSKGRGAHAVPFVDLHMDSLKKLLVEPLESPTSSKPPSRQQSTRQRSDAALAHQARLKMPLRSSIKATQALYTGKGDSLLRTCPVYQSEKICLPIFTSCRYPKIHGQETKCNVSRRGQRVNGLL